MGPLEQVWNQNNEEKGILCSQGWCIDKTDQFRAPSKFLQSHLVYTKKAVTDAGTKAMPRFVSCH